MFPLICPPPPVVVDVVGHWLMRTAGVTVRQFRKEFCCTRHSSGVSLETVPFRLLDTIKAFKSVLRKVSFLYTVHPAPRDIVFKHGTGGTITTALRKLSRLTRIRIGAPREVSRTPCRAKECTSISLNSQLQRVRRINNPEEAETTTSWGSL